MTLYSINSIANEIKVDAESIRRLLARKGIAVKGTVSDQALKVIAETYSKKRTGRKTETIEAAKRLFSTSSVVEVKTVNKITPKSAAATTRKKKKKATTGINSNTFLFVVFISALVWQMIHNGGLVMRISMIEIAMLKYAASGLFAFSVQFTALLMTIKTNQTKYLLGFAFVEFIINILYYEPWEKGNDPTYWATVIVVSAAIAFTIFSYSKMLVEKDN